MSRKRSASKNTSSSRRKSAQKKSALNKKHLRYLGILAGAIALGVVLATAGFAFAAVNETHDSFCASCHTQPESTFYQRSTDAQAVDLASFHTPQKTRCIDCHSGVGITGRMQAELLGAHNALAWYTHTAVQPAKQTVPISDANCLKCHQDVTQRGYVPKNPMNLGGGGGEEAGTNHWHEFLSQWQAISSTAGTCTSCHSGHSTDGSAQTGFENLQTTRDVCNACHQMRG
jgi:nitrate/TMAO reductase-like tetraheme cytochrome c subunit